MSLTPIYDQLREERADLDWAQVAPILEPLALNLDLMGCPVPVLARVTVSPVDANDAFPDHYWTRVDRGHDPTPHPYLVHEQAS